MRSLSPLGPLAAGATLGGLFVGMAEGLYRGVPLVYAAFLYAALWALAGSALALLLSLRRRRRPWQALHTWGLTLALFSSTLVLVRFIVIRDIFAEAPGKGLHALAAGLVAAVLVTACVQIAGRWVRHRFLADRLTGAWQWILPLASVLVFGLLSLSGDDVLPEVARTPAKPLGGRGVILVVVDTLRADALGVYGAKDHRGAPATPALDAFAKESVLFRDVSAQASWTRPAVASILTSRHVSGHDTMEKNAVLPSSLPTLASELQAHGVKTAAVVTNYNLEAAYGFARGFDTFRYLAPARYLGAPEEASRLAAYNALRLLRERFFTASREARFFYRSGANVNAQAFELLDGGLGNGEFFLWLHYMEPHDPYFSVDGRSYARVSTPKPPAAWAEDMHAAYKDGVRRYDSYFAELVAGLRARGLYDTTSLVFVSDHGEEFAEHGGFYHGTTLYEEQLDVPLIVRTPGVTAKESLDLARQIDVAPTVLARFGKPAPASWEGRDLLGDTAAPDTTLAEENHEGNVLAAVRVGQTKLIMANPDNPRGLLPTEMYDLGSDPREQYNKVDGEALATLKAVLAERQNLARRGGAKAAQKQLDSDAEAELRSLGYVQ